MMRAIMDRMHPLPGARCASTAEALVLFDRLDAVEVTSLLGTWRGSTFPSGHPFDGALEACGWHGKTMVSADAVHPLVFQTWAGRLALRPRGLAPGLPLLLRWPVLKPAGVAMAVRALLPLLATRTPRARLRMIEHRGRVTAAMVYDEVAIVDVFRRVDAETVLGAMQWKGMEQPFFFLLRREAP